MALTAPAIRVLSGAVVAVLSSAAGLAQEPPVLLEPRPGFAVDLVAQSPDVLWPSANLCLDDGSLVVGEDRMDMPGPSDQPLDRLIRFRFKPDGTWEKTVFADHLYAVFGLELVDGAVLVMNMPHLTLLRDTDGDGVADERKELLTDLGQVAPGWPGGFNDHIVSGIRLGLDGFLYVAVGDKGIPLAHGTDGSTLTLRGGGIVRLWPDGSKLEIVASGLRNILDVAIDERGEMFTHDNTDDGLGWWTRLTHIVVGGYYGYPWDYHDHPERMLPCMKDFGGGSPTGGLVYREAAWPAPYAGSLFFCEWAKGILRRFEVAPDGAGFKVAKDEDFVVAGKVSEFRPVDVCESPDGRFLYISDWAFGGWTNPKECGRIWRVRRADDDPNRASTMRSLPTDANALVATLDDPSYRRRLSAQRALALRADEVRALPALDALVHGQTGSARQRRHALWLERELEPGDALDLGHGSIDSSDPGQRAGVARALRWGGRDRAELLARLLVDSDLVVRREAVIALRGLVDDKRWGPPPDPDMLARWNANFLAALQASEDRTLRFSIVQTMNSLGLRLEPELQPASIQPELLELLRNHFEAAAVWRLGNFALAPIDSELRARALRSVAEVLRQREPWNGKWWQTQPAASPPPRPAIDWVGTPAASGVLRDAVRSEDLLIRRAAVEAIRDLGGANELAYVRERAEHERVSSLLQLELDVLAERKDLQAGPLLARILHDRGAESGVREHAIEAACKIRTPAMVDDLIALVLDEQAHSEQRLACLRALGQLDDAKLVPVYEKALVGPDESVSAEALRALARVEKAGGERRLLAALFVDSLSVRRAALEMLALYGTQKSVEPVLRCAHDAALQVEAYRALAHVPDLRALDTFLTGTASTSKAVIDASMDGLRALRGEARAEIEARAAAGRLEPAQISCLQSIYGEPEPLSLWSSVGPFPRDGKEPSADEVLAFFRAKEADPDTSLRGKRANAMTGRPRDGFVDLETQVSKDTNVVAFAWTAITSARPRKATFLAGSDDMIAVWINGKLVHDFGGNRAWTLDQDRFEVELPAGTSTVLARIGQGTGQWSFNVKVSPDESGALFDARASDPVADYRSYALEHAGDPTSGEHIFRASSTGALCVRCHKVDGQGGEVGPDLSDVGAKYPRTEILESILQPSQRILEGYKSSWFELDDGHTVFGRVRRENADEVTVWDTQGEERVVTKKEIVARGEGKTSAMPDGLLHTLSKQELADLVAWLSTLRGKPAVK